MNNQSIWDTITHYDSYYRVKRTERQKYILYKGIERFIHLNDLENPNEYLLYLIADKSISKVSARKEQYMISELADELQKDLHLFKK